MRDSRAEMLVGRFLFNQNVWFEFSATSRSEWNSIFQNFQKEDNLARYAQILKKIFPDVLFSLNFASGNF